MPWLRRKAFRSPLAKGPKGAKGVLILLALLTLGWAWQKWSEPRYLGRPVSSWIRQSPYDNASGSETDQALNFFGERAVPYLIDAMERPLKWEHGPLSRIPHRYVDRLLDLDQLRQVRRSAMARLQQLIWEESERGDVQLDPTYPLATRLLPIWKRELRLDSTGEILSGFETLGGRMTNLAPELQRLFPRLSPTRHEWAQAALMLSETHDPIVVDLLVPFIHLTNSGSTAHWALMALGRNGIATEKAQVSVLTALPSTNSSVRWAALQAAARLAMNRPEVLDALEQLKSSSLPSSEVERLTIAEPVLRWNRARKDAANIARVEQNLSSSAPAYVRLNTADILQCLGPQAHPFLPALESMALDSNRVFRAPAIRAIRWIDPNEARRFLLQRGETAVADDSSVPRSKLKK